jgi:hypothetical protein
MKALHKVILGVLCFTIIFTVVLYVRFPLAHIVSLTYFGINIGILFVVWIISQKNPSA